LFDSDDEARESESLSLAVLEDISRSLKALAVPRETVAPVAQVTGLPRARGRRWFVARRPDWSPETFSAMTR